MRARHVYRAFRSIRTWSRTHLRLGFLSPLPLSRCLSVCLSVCPSDRPVSYATCTTKPHTDQTSQRTAQAEQTAPSHTHTRVLNPEKTDQVPLYTTPHQQHERRMHFINSRARGLERGRGRARVRRELGVGLMQCNAMFCSVQFCSVPK